MTEPDASPRAALSGRARKALAVVVVLGAVLRGVRLLHPDFQPDEYFEVFARQMVLEHAVPRMPSGVLWLYGGWLLPVGAVGTWIGGADVFWNRLPLCLFSIATIWLVGRTAIRLWGEGGGIVAAAAVALHPGHVEFSANVKCYGALACLVAWAADRWTRWILEREDRAAPGFALAFAAAALVHPGAAFLLPGFVVSGVLARGTRWLVARRTLLTFAGCALPLAAFWWAIVTFDAGLVPTLATSATADGPAELLRERIGRIAPALGSHGWHSSWHATYFWLSLAAAAAAVVLFVRTRRPLASCPAGGAAVCFLAWALSAESLAILSKNIGAIYLVHALPLLALATGAAFAWLASALGNRVQVGAVAVLVGTIHAVVTRDAWDRVLRPNPAYAELMRSYSDARAGDLSLGGGPHAALASGGRVLDHLVYGGPVTVAEFIRDGRRHDRIFGRRVLGTPAEVQSAFDASPRVWYLVSDKELASGRVTAEVHAWLTSRMRLVAESAGSPSFQLWVRP